MKKQILLLFILSGVSLCPGLNQLHAMQPNDDYLQEPEEYQQALEVRPVEAQAERQAAQQALQRMQAERQAIQQALQGDPQAQLQAAQRMQRL